MISFKKNFIINPVLLTNIVFAFFPISFIFGNLVTNINVILFCALGIFHLRSKIIKTKFDFVFYSDFHIEKILVVLLKLK